MHDMEQNGGIEISLQRLLRAVLEKLWLLILAAALGTGIALSVGYCFVTPQYQSSVVLYVNTEIKSHFFFKMPSFIDIIFSILPFFCHS